MPEELRELYIDSGFWAHPILISTLVLFVVGSIMLFTVRLIKRFILFSIIALILPNGIGIIGYIEETESIEEAVIEGGTEFTEEMMESAEELSVKPMYLGFLGSAVTIVLGLAGILKVRLSRRSPPSS